MNSLLIRIRERSAAFWGAVLFSLLANAFAFFYWNPCHDAVNHAFHFASEWEVSLGRYLQPIYGNLRGDITTVWFIGCIGTVFAALSACLVVDLLRITRPIFMFIVGGFFAANLSVTEVCGTFLYVYDCFMISLFFACLGVWIWVKTSSVWKIPISCACLVISLGLYQAFISVAIVLAILTFIYKVYENKSWREYTKFVISGGVILLCSGGIYYGMWQYALKKWEVSAASSYNGLSQIKHLSLGVLIERVLKTYNDVYCLFFSTEYFSTVIVWIHAFLFISVGVLIILALVRRKLRLYNYILIMIAICIMPIGANLVGLLSELGIELRCSYSLFLFYPICLALIEKFLIKDVITSMGIRVSILYAMVCLFVLMGNIKFSNGVYVYSEVVYERTISIMTRVLDNMEGQEGYMVNDTPVAVLGRIDHNTNYCSDVPEQYKNLAGVPSIATTNVSKTYRFWENMGIKVNGITDQDILKKLSQYKEVQAMPCYPYNGYCKMVNGVMVVKLSE